MTTMKRTVMIALLSCLLLTACTFSEGSSKDRVYGYDVGPVWGHMYLYNDHTTAYCFDPIYKSAVQNAYDNNLTLKVHYATYLIKGSLCSTSDKYDNVVVTSLEVTQ